MGAVYTSMTAAVEPPAQRIIHDVPPIWDGKDPDSQAEPYLKLLQGWLSTTRTLKTQRGMTILHYSQGDLKLIINELEVEILTSDHGGQRVWNHIQEAYLEHLDKKLPKAMERALFSPEGRRQKHESMVQYVARKKTLLAEPTRAKCPLPSNALGYILLRDAHLPERAWDTIDNWCKGEYDLATVATNLRKLERPIPGRGGSHLAGMSTNAFTGDSDSFYDHQSEIGTDSSRAEPIFMKESLFVNIDDFDGELLDRAVEDTRDPDILYVSGDIAQDVMLEEDEAVAILANYGQV